jgi:hypothetical protein
MTKRRLVLLAITGAAFLGLAAALILPRSRRGEPSYAGKRLSEWLGICLEDHWNGRNSASLQAEVATRQIGTNAIPFLLRWLRAYEVPPAWRWDRYEAADRFARNFGGRVISWKFIEATEPAMYRGNIATEGFRILGPEAKAAIPELTEMMNDPKRSENARNYAIWALIYLGQDGMPALISAMTNQAASNRVGVVARIHHAGTNAVRAVPALLTLVNDQDPRLRWAATNALRQIAPEALPNAPPE